MIQATTSRPWLTLNDMAERLGLPVGTVRKMRHTGKLPRAVVMGRQLRWHISDVEQWEDERRSAASA